MYYFKVQGFDCSCDTAEELFNAMERQNSKPPVVVKNVSGVKPKSKRRKKAKKLSSEDLERIKALPYVAEGITWDVAKKFGKKLKRKDLLQLRSDLFQRQKLGE